MFTCRLESNTAAQVMFFSYPSLTDFFLFQGLSSRFESRKMKRKRLQMLLKVSKLSQVVSLRKLERSFSLLYYSETSSRNFARYWPKRSSDSSVFLTQLITFFKFAALFDFNLFRVRKSKTDLDVF